MNRRSSAAEQGDSLVDGAYKTLRGRILDNVWAPGFQAMEEELSLQLGMSRTPVHEALVRLANEGLVEIVPRRGMRVLPVSPAAMQEIYQILGALESLAAELVAARRPAQAQLKPLIAATRAMEKALAQGDLDAWAEADESFHDQLVAMAGNKLLAEAVALHRDRSHRARMFTLRLRPVPVNSTQEHMALVERLRVGDAAGAAAANRQHRERASRELVSIFERYRLQQL